jgi:hypothetical protein
MHNRRQSRAVQNLVGIGVANAREKPRIRERALQGVVLAFEPIGKCGKVRFLDLEATGVEAREHRSIRDKVQRRSPFRSRFGERKRAGIEFEGRERNSPRRLLLALEPP